MDVKSYCDTLENQLTSWKANINERIKANAAKFIRTGQRAVDSGFIVVGIGVTGIARFGFGIAD